MSTLTIMALQATSRPALTHRRPSQSSKPVTALRQGSRYRSLPSLFGWLFGEWRRLAQAASHLTGHLGQVELCHTDLAARSPAHLDQRSTPRDSARLPHCAARSWRRAAKEFICSEAHKWWFLSSSCSSRSYA